MKTPGFVMGGSDFAEALPARNRLESYVPGDVLVITRDGSGVEKTTEPYSRRLVGVCSTRPGVLGADKDGETRVDPEDVPVTVLGIVPTRVSAENGPIEVGDLLVTSSTSGYAMRGTKPDLMLGATIGKALEPMTENTATLSECSSACAERTCAKADGRANGALAFETHAPARRALRWLLCT